MPRGAMSSDHKEALARGRRQAKAVRDYLEALQTDGRRGRPVDRDSLGKRVQRLQEQIDQETNPGRRVELIQQRLDAEQRLTDMHDSPDAQSLEKDFIDSAREYSERKGISYTAWREAGVPAAVLREAGIPRTRRTNAA